MPWTRDDWEPTTDEDFEALERFRVWLRGARERLENTYLVIDGDDVKLVDISD